MVIQQQQSCRLKVELKLFLTEEFRFILLFIAIYLLSPLPENVFASLSIDAHMKIAHISVTFPCNVAFILNPRTPALHRLKVEHKVSVPYT